MKYQSKPLAHSGGVSESCRSDNRLKLARRLLFLGKIHLIADYASHKIHRLSARYGRIIYAAEIETDLRVIFYIEGTTVVTVEIGSHAVYRAKLHAPIESGQSKEAVR